MITSEHWKPIKDFPDYAISNIGRVKRLTVGRGVVAGRILRNGIDTGGYCYLILWRNGYRSPKLIHALVLTAFRGHRPGKMECNHLDGNKTNNCIENLEWVSRSANMKHAYRIGLRDGQRGENNGQAKLKWTQIDEIRCLVVMGATQKEIASIFGVTREAISYVSNSNRGGWVT